MAINKGKITEKTTPTEEEKRPGWTLILKHVGAKVFAGRSYVLLALNEEQQKQIEAESPVEVEIRDGVMLANISKYAKFAISGDVVDQDAAAGRGWANVKLRYASYDYTYKGKKGHTEKLELLGLRFSTFEAYDELTGLDDDSDDGLGDDELPF